MHKDLSELIGFQIISLDATTIKVRRGDGKVFDIHIIDDGGDCCGFNDIETKLFVEKNSHRNPVITSVSQVVDDNRYESTCKVTFFGEEKTIAQINTCSSSGSGWCYGACVSVKCDELDIDNILSSW